MVKLKLKQERQPRGKKIKTTIFWLVLIIGLLFANTFGEAFGDFLSEEIFHTGKADYAKEIEKTFDESFISSCYDDWKSNAFCNCVLSDFKYKIGFEALYNYADEYARTKVAPKTMETLWINATSKCSGTLSK